MCSMLFSETILRSQAGFEASFRWTEMQLLSHLKTVHIPVQWSVLLRQDEAEEHSRTS